MTGSGRLRYPDFICIGAKKAGTTWLHKALSQHPDIWLPPFKEIQYFNRAHPPPYLANGSQSRFAPHDAQRLDNLLKAMKAAASRPLPADEKLEEVNCLGLIARSEFNDEWYGGIFAYAPDSAKCGEVSPDYALLPDAGIEHILRLKPDTKFIFLMRDPIERAWSHLRMAEQGGVRIEKIRRISRPLFMSYSDYASTIERYRSHVAKEDFLELFIDDVAAAPNQVLRSTCSFLGVDSMRASFRDVDARVNAGQGTLLDDEIRAKLREAFAPLYRRLLKLDNPITYKWYLKHYGGERSNQRAARV